VNESNEICGIFTARDILRCINEHEIGMQKHTHAHSPAQKRRQSETMEDFTGMYVCMYVCVYV
jgi:hypothetical protein